ncbi:MAG: hypothetical protein ACLFQZ_09045 [Spirochaetaceae bacterium]
MRKLPLLLFLLLAGTLLWAQSIPLREIDFEEAKISVAGPEAFYIRNVGFQGERYAVLIGRSTDDGWTVRDLYAESDNVTPREMILDFATIRLEGENSLVLDGIFVDGAVYQGRLRVGEDDRAQLADRFSSSSLESLDPARLRKLRETILEVVAPEYEERLTLLQEELRSARERINQQDMIIEELRRENVALEDRLSEREEELSVLKDRVSALEEELASAEESPGPEEPERAVDPGPTDSVPGVSQLDLARVERDIRALRGEAEGVAAFLEELQKENEMLLRENEELRVSLERAREELAEAREAPMPAPEPSRASQREAKAREIATATELLHAYKDRLRSTSLTGFEAGRARMGSWRIVEDEATQTDPGEYFSRFALPLEQLREPTLFSFRGRSLESTEWTGFGLHLFASAVEAPNGYGHGESLLIWFTRDREHYGNDHTYLQVYRSSDDVTMNRVAEGIIPEPISSPLEIDILYQPEVGDVTIGVNGEVKLLYNGWFGIDSGMEIALRTKGRGRFEDLRVRTGSTAR